MARLTTYIALLLLTSLTVRGFEEEPGSGSWTLLGVAKHESRAEAEKRGRVIREIIEQLGIYTDPDLIFVQQKKEELLAFGRHAVPYLAEAMANPSMDRDDINAGRTAASLLARISDPAATEAALRLLGSEDNRTRANAVVCLGEMGLKQETAKVKEYLATKNKILVPACLICLGRFGTEEMLELAGPFLDDPDPEIRVAALQALDLAGDGSPAARSKVLDTLRNANEPKVYAAALKYIGRYGREDAVPVLIERYHSPTLRQKEQDQILDCLLEVGLRSGEVFREKIILFLKDLLTQRDLETVKTAAVHLNALGDESGVKVLTAGIDQLIAKHGKAEYLFRRAEIYLQFKKYKEAKRDYLDGLRKDKKAEHYGAQKVYLGLARCYAGENRYGEAERYLKKAHIQDPSYLPKDYEEFRGMAEDERYIKLFQTNGS